MVAVFSMKRGGVEGHEVIDGVEVHYIGPLITMTCPGGAFDVGSLLAAVRGDYDNIIDVQTFAPLMLAFLATIEESFYYRNDR